LLAFAAVGAGTVFSFSRAAWLNLAIACAVVVLAYLARRRGVRRAVKAVVALAVCGAAGFAFLSATGSLAFLNERAKLQGYDNQRFANQASGLEHATVHVLGYGPGQVEDVLAFSSHSLPVRLLVEQGLLGLALFGMMIVTTVFFAILWAGRDGDLHGVGSAALLGSLLGLIANSPFVDTLHWRHLWLVLALIWAGIELDRDRHEILAVEGNDRRE
jgi:Na+/melibiose symporter-like transporter